MILTTENVGAAAPELLRNEVDQRLTKLRPMATPLDQIARYAESRSCGSMTVDYYAVDSRPAEATAVKATTLRYDQVATLAVDVPQALEPSETAMVNGVTTQAGTPLVIYVVSVGDSSMRVKGVNLGEGEEITVSAGETLVRMGRAAGELDVQTSNFVTLPKKQQNFCQIFKTQVEQSTLLSTANKEVGWSFSDQEEVAIYDMRLGMERSFLFGSKARITDPDKKSEVFLTGGIWNQVQKQAIYEAGALTNESWLEVMSLAFTGHAGSPRKVLFAGTKLVEELHKITAGSSQRVVGSEEKVSRWGLDFTEMHSKFGTLMVIHSEVFDKCGHENDGLIVDPEYLSKYVRVPFNATSLDLRTSGQRNTQAVVMTEVSCLVLRYPEAHVKVMGR